MNFLNDIARFKLIQIVVFGSVLMGVFYFTLYDDGTYLKKMTADVQNNIDQTEVKIKKTNQELNNVKEFEKEILAEEDIVKYFLNFIPESFTYTDLSSLLINSAKVTGINIEIKKDQAVKIEKDSDYHTLEIQLTIDGSFSQIMFFLSRLTAQKRMLILKNISMNIENKNNMIKANLTIEAYRYQKKDDTAEEKVSENK